MRREPTDLPAAHPDIVWAPLLSSDAVALQELLAQVEEAEALPYRTSLNEIEALLQRSVHWRAVAGYEVLNAASPDSSSDAEPGEMVAFGYVGLNPDESKEVVCHGAVIPRRRGAGIGSTVLQWQTRAGARLIEVHSEGGSGTLTHQMASSDDDFKAGLSALGYRPEGSAIELRADVTAWMSEGVPPSYVSVVPWSEDLDDLARRAFNRVNAELGADAKASKSQWAQMNQVMRPEWSFVALSSEGDRPRVVGMISTGGYEQDWEALGWKEGVLQIVAVFEPDGHDEILRSLLDGCIQALRKDGIDNLSVTLDPIDDEHTMNFYQRNGFQVSRRFDTYSLPIRNGPRLVPPLRS